MNKCILFSLGLARDGVTNEKVNLKQMVKSNKNLRKVRATDRARECRRDREESK